MLSQVLLQDDYYPFGLTFNSSERSGFLTNSFLYNGKELQEETGWYDYGARMYDAAIGRWHSSDPNASNYLHISNYNYVSSNPINILDPDGKDWYDINGSIEWRDNEGELNINDVIFSSLGKNVLVGWHNRNSDGEEGLNSAVFELYLESNTEGATATINGNTIPADIEDYGTLAEGLFPASSQARASYPNERALIISNGGELPTVNGNPNNSNSDNLTEIFFHSGNNYQSSLFDSNGIPYSKGCQTGGCGEGSLGAFNTFMSNVASDFNGNYYLRSLNGRNKGLTSPGTSSFAYPSGNSSSGGFRLPSLNIGRAYGNLKSQVNSFVRGTEDWLKNGGR